MQIVIHTRFGILTAPEGKAVTYDYAIMVVRAELEQDGEIREYTGFIPWHQVNDVELVEG